jgi:hypothetical protein
MFRLTRVIVKLRSEPLNVFNDCVHFGIPKSLQYLYLFTVCRIFLCSLTVCNTSSLLIRSVQLFLSLQYIMYVFMYDILEHFEGWSKLFWEFLIMEHGIFFMETYKQLTRRFFIFCILWYWCFLPKTQLFLPKAEYLSTRLQVVTVHSSTKSNISATKTWQLSPLLIFTKSSFQYSLYFLSLLFPVKVLRQRTEHKEGHHVFGRRQDAALLMFLLLRLLCVDCYLLVTAWVTQKDLEISLIHRVIKYLDMFS